MTQNKNRQWVLNARPGGKLTGEEFRWNEVPIPQPSDGQVLIRTLWLSIDPAQRINHCFTKSCLATAGC